MTENTLCHRSHKYAWKEFKNGSWRYYYDDDGKRDKGFSIKRISKKKSQNNVYQRTSDGKLHAKTSKRYYVGGDRHNKAQKVSKDVYNHAGASLYYKNEPVIDIVKRNLRQMKKATTKNIKKGRKAFEKYLNR